MALAFVETWVDINKDSLASEAGLDMEEDLFDDRIWIY